MVNLRENNGHRPSWMIIGGFMVCIIGSTLIMFGTMGAAIPLVIIGSVIIGGVLGAGIGGFVRTQHDIIRNRRM